MKIVKNKLQKYLSKKLVREGGKKIFNKNMGLADPVPNEGIKRAVEILKKSDLYRYGTPSTEVSETTQLEKDFAKYTGAKYALAVNSCSSALFLSLISSGIKPGDEVLVPAVTFTAVPSAIINAGAIPVLIECTESYQIEITDRTEARTRIQYNYDTEQAKLDKLLDLLTDGVINNEEYQRKKAELKLNREAIKQELEKNEKMADQGMELTERTFNFARYAQYWFEKGTNEQKRIILRTLGSNLLLKDQILLFQERKPFIMVKNLKAKYGVLLEKFEPADLTDNSIQNPSLAKVIPSLLRDMDSNHD